MDKQYVKVESEAFNQASLQIERAQGIIEALFTLACNDHIESIGSDKLASTLDAVNDLLSQSQALMLTN
jgi:hypothetical protein